MRKLVCLCVLFLLAAAPGFAQTVIDTFTVRAPGDTVNFYAELPANYNPAAPPAILIWWHQYGSDEWEMYNSQFNETAAARGWICASHRGPNTTHYNTRGAQQHCQAMLDWISERYPFSMDSIYMIGGSMGGAAGQIWHNNNCGIHDYLIAAFAGGSQILDCHFRQEQYLHQTPSDTNRAMRREFGGLPADCSAVAFEYHRYSAVFAEDTTQSMHFNSLHLPVWNSWGNNAQEQERYGLIAGMWADIRTAGGADSTLSFQSNIGGHGIGVMPVADVVDWLSRFTVNRFPDTLSINADENDEYYWTRVELADTHTVFGRYGVARNEAARRIDLQLIRNIRDIVVECEFPWADWDTLHGFWSNLDNENVPDVTVRLAGTPTVLAVELPDGTPLPFTYADDTLTVPIQRGGELRVVFEPAAIGAPSPALPASMVLAAAYPNPFNGQVCLEIQSNLAAPRELRFYDVNGRLAKSLTVALQPGQQRVVVSTSDLASGVYFATLQGAAASPVKLVLLK